MTPILNLIRGTGPILVAIMLLSVVLYTRCFQFMFRLRAERRRLEADAGVGAIRIASLRVQRDALRENMNSQRMMIGAMIAAAPLLGLLGTVIGMVTTFESLSKTQGQSSMDGLAHGISEVLLSTESGLVVALPAMLLMYLAHGTARKCFRRLNDLEEEAREEPPT
jgi:biopolymer transport protein ExbB